MRAGVLGLLTASDRGVARQVPPAQKRTSVNSTSLDVLPDGGTLHLLQCVFDGDVILVRCLVPTRSIRSWHC